MLMNAFVIVGERRFAAAELLELLTQYQLLPTVLKALIVDSALKEIVLTKEEEELALEQFYAQHQLNEEESQNHWLTSHRINSEQLLDQALREFKLTKFKSMTWGGALEKDFLQYKPKLDRYVYSLIRTTNAELAQELYFRLQEGEQTFRELAPQYSEGAEAQTGGRIGPVTAASLHPNVVQLLSRSKPGQICPPQRFGEWNIIVCLEQCIAAQLDETVCQQLLERRYQEWMAQKLQSLCVSAPGGVAS
jgi:parvulin-like peptidyl-prolyl isomerase